jgi:uncharacterized membrane protein/glutaredoxin
MHENFNFLFKYLEKEQVFIDKTEFEYQIQSHPEYPSLLAISDTLFFFNIDNIATRIEKFQIELLPDYFVALLMSEANIPVLNYVEKKGNNYFVTNNKKAKLISKQELESIWAEITLLVDKPDIEVGVKHNRERSYMPTSLLLWFGLFFSVLFTSKTTILIVLFFVFPILGILFSIAALKDLFGAKSKLINNFCNITASSSCNSIVNSNKWKIFEILNFSDLSIVFFVFQFVGLFFSILTNNMGSFFSIQKIFLLISLPVILTSLYYQKFVEKKWCPICLVIITIILSEIFYLFSMININFSISTNYLFSLGLVAVGAVITWQYLKQLLLRNKEQKEDLFKALRFERNYENFKNNLLLSPKVVLPYSPIILGNSECSITITIISSPFCGHCKKAHEIIEKIIERHHKNVCVNVILKSDFSRETEESKMLFRDLYKLYNYKKQELFLKGMNFWFNNNDLKLWRKIYNLVTDYSFDKTIISHNQWCIDYDFNFTPVIFINGHQYPNSYDRETLLYFINDLIEDEF